MVENLDLLCPHRQCFSASKSGLEKLHPPEGRLSPTHGLSESIHRYADAESSMTTHSSSPHYRLDFLAVFAYDQLLLAC